MTGGGEIERLIEAFARLPGLGPRSARRAVLTLIKKRDRLMAPLIAALEEVAATVRPCAVCGNLDTRSPCGICADPHREAGLLCVVEEVGDLWALERSRAFRGRYHVLGGRLSALAGVGPEDLAIEPLVERVAGGGIDEVILALNPTVEGQTTAHWVRDRLVPTGVMVSQLASGVPLGGELGYLDDGTLTAAIRQRRRT